MLVPLRFDIAGDVQVSRMFQATSEAAQDLSEPFQLIGGLILQTVARQFGTEGANGLGTRWTALSEPYATWKARHYPGKPILEATGDMRRSMTSPDAVHVERDRLLYEPDDPKAIHHQRGDGNLPARQIVALTGLERRQWDRVLLTWLRHAEGRATWPPTLETP